METRTEANLTQLASDVHLLTTPVRLLWHVLITTLCILSFPLLCALVSLHYVIGNLSPVRAYCHFMTAHHIPAVLYPFALLGAFAMIPVEAVVQAVQAIAEIFDGIWRIVSAVWDDALGFGQQLLATACPCNLRLHRQRRCVQSACVVARVLWVHRLAVGAVLRSPIS
jgi:hypothetical protein